MKKSISIHVLFLSAWYPNRLDAMSGLFVRKHAEAVSSHCRVSVLYVQEDKNIQRVEKEIIEDKNIREIKIYYPSRFDGILKNLYKLIMLFYTYHIGYLEVAKFGKPDIVHSNILTRTGFMALFMKLLRGIPYVLSEHWSRYLFDEHPAYKGIFRKYLTKLVVKNAETVMPVSALLEKAMLNHKLYNDDYQVVGNVVDPCFYNNPLNNNKKMKQILHVSCFEEKSKNISGILLAGLKLSNIRKDFKLILAGTGPDFNESMQYAEKLNFPEGIVEFTGEKTPVEIAQLMLASDLFVLFSNYETAGIVIAESMISGIPVISTTVGIASEYIDSKTGILIDKGDVDALAVAMNQILNHPDDYPSDYIRNKVSDDFSYAKIGTRLYQIYLSALKLN